MKKNKEPSVPSAAPGAPKLTKKQTALQAIKFTLFSISAGAIQMISSTICKEVFHWPAAVCYAIGLVLSVLWNFTFNRKFTFKSANNIPIAMLKVAGYYAVFSPLSIWWVDALVGIGWNYYLVQIGTMLINFVTEFTFDRFVVFGKSINTNDLGKKEQQKMLEENQKRDLKDLPNT